VVKPVTFLSPYDLARAVGVSESSVKRWADDGRLEFVRTAGGHRRIRVAEAVRFVREAGLDLLRPDLLGMGPTETRSRALGAPTIDALVEAISNRDDGAVRQMLVSSFLQGESVAALCDGPIRGALEVVGHLWKEGPDGIAIEHQAVDACAQALMEIRGMTTVPKKAPLAIGGAVEGDPYLLPSLMSAIVLADLGFRTVNLGPDVPGRALHAAVRHRDPKIVWRSSSIEISTPRLRADLAEVSKGFRRTPELVLGGRGLPRPVKSPSDAHVFGSMTELAGFAKGLRRAGRQRSA